MTTRDTIVVNSFVHLLSYQRIMYFIRLDCGSVQTSDRLNFCYIQKKLNPELFEWLFSSSQSCRFYQLFQFFLVLHLLVLFVCLFGIVYWYIFISYLKFTFHLAGCHQLKQYISAYHEDFWLNLERDEGKKESEQILCLERYLQEI